MRLARTTPSPERDRRLAGVVPPPNGSLPAPSIEDVFLAAYARLHGRILDHAGRFVSEDDARDAVQDAWLAIWRAWQSPTLARRDDRYVFTAVRNCVKLKLRENNRLVSLDDAEPELDQQATTTFRDDARGTTMADVLDAALLVMSPRRREILLLVKEQGFTYAEVAEMLGLSLGTINTHIRLAYEDLRVAFRRAGYYIADPKARQKRLPAPKTPTGGTTND